MTERVKGRRDGWEPFVRWWTLAAALIAVVTSVIRYFTGPFSPVVFSGGVAATVVLIVAHLVSWRRGWERYGAILFVLAGLGLAFFAAYHGLGIHAPFLVSVPILPALAALLWGPRAALRLALLVVSGVMFIYFSGDERHLALLNSLDPQRLALARFAWVVGTTVGLTALSWRYVDHASRIEARLMEMATTDPLTGLYNRRAIEASATAERNRARRDGGWLSILYFDVDHFKAYNDLNGHLEGDACLRRLAGGFDGCFRRAGEVVGRIGGEEFLGILPGATPSDAKEHAERLRQAVEALAIPRGPGAEGVVTITIGVASGRGEALGDRESLVRAADDALGEGKRGGRNQVRAVVLDGLSKEGGAP